MRTVTRVLQREQILDHASGDGHQSLGVQALRRGGPEDMVNLEHESIDIDDKGSGLSQAYGISLALGVGVSVNSINFLLQGLVGPMPARPIIHAEGDGFGPRGVITSS